MNLSGLKLAISEFVENSDGGIQATDIFDANGGMPIVGYNSNAKASALFNRIFNQLVKTLDGSGFDSNLDFYFLRMDNNQAVIVGRFKKAKYRFGVLVDLNKIQLGMMLNVLLPEYLEAVNDAL